MDLFLSLFHQVMGVKKHRNTRIYIKKTVSIPFSSGHGGKEVKIKMDFKELKCFYPFFIRSWG